MRIFKANTMFTESNYKQLNNERNRASHVVVVLQVQHGQKITQTLKYSQNRTHTPRSNITTRVIAGGIIVAFRKPRSWTSTSASESSSLPSSSAMSDSESAVGRSGELSNFNGDDVGSLSRSISLYDSRSYTSVSRAL